MTAAEVPESRTLIPFDIREAISINEAAGIAGKSGGTIRIWCERFAIGRRVGGGIWRVSKADRLLATHSRRTAFHLANTVMSSSDERQKRPDTGKPFMHFVLQRMPLQGRHSS